MVPDMDPYPPALQSPNVYGIYRGFYLQRESKITIEKP